MNFSDRLAKIAGAHPFAWAAEREIPKATMAVWLSGAKPQKKSLERLEVATGIPVDWWRHGSWPPPGWDDLQSRVVPTEAATRRGESEAPGLLEVKRPDGYADRPDERPKASTSHKTRENAGGGEYSGALAAGVKGLVAFSVGAGKTSSSVLPVALALRLGRAINAAEWLPDTLGLDESEALVRDAMGVLVDHYGDRRQLIDRLANSDSVLDAALRLAWEAARAGSD